MHWLVLHPATVTEKLYADTLRTIMLDTVKPTSMTTSIYHQKLETAIREHLTVSHFMYLTIKARRRPITPELLTDKFLNGGIADTLREYDPSGYYGAILEIKNS